MRLKFSQIILFPTIWAALMLAALQTPIFFTESTQSICGPWGCGPPTGALVTAHVVWLALIGPPLIYLPWRLRWSSRAIHWLSLSLFLVSLIGTASMVIWQWLVWLPQVGDWSKDFFWQRCGFVVATTVDLPLIPLAVVSIVLWTNVGGWLLPDQLRGVRR